MSDRNAVAALAAELESLRAEVERALATISNAEQSAKEGEGRLAIDALKLGARSIASFAEKVAAPLVTALIKDSIG